MLKQKHWHQLVIDLLALNAKIKGCSFFLWSYGVCFGEKTALGFQRY